MYLIGIDIGTTTISAAVLDFETKDIVETKTILNVSFMDTGKDWEKLQDADGACRKAKELLDVLLDRYVDTISIGLTGQMHGVVYLNSAGNAVSPLYTWQDGRGNLPEFQGESAVTLVNKKYGLKEAAGYGLITHFYNLKQGIVPSGARVICTIGDYLGVKLTGRRIPLLHVSNGAGLGFYDSEGKHFRVDILEQLGMDQDILPQVITGFEEIGSYRGIPVTVAVGDNQASFLGSVGLEEQTALVNMGTGGQMSILSKQYFAAKGIEARPLTGDVYLLVGSSLCGGRAYALLRKFFSGYAKLLGAITGEVQYDIMEQMARAGKTQYAGFTNDRMKVITTFNGTRENPCQRGSILNISEDNFTPEGLTYGVLEGMAWELYDFYQQIERGTEIRIHRIVGSGNGLRKNKVLQEIFEEMFQSTLSLSRYEEEAACGAALCKTLCYG